MATDLPHGYRPLDEEPFMNEQINKNEDERNHEFKLNYWIQEYGHYKNFMENLTYFRDSFKIKNSFIQTGCRAEFSEGFA